MASYGEVGVNIGSFGRWTRFVLGILIIALVATDFYPVTHTHSAASYLIMALSFAGIIIVYTLVHITIGNKLSGKSAWWGTLIFAAPVLFLLLGPSFYPSLQVGHWLNMPVLNHPFMFALLLYVGTSFFVQWGARYGGCEVVAIPNFLFRKNYRSYCVPLLPLDVIEKVFVEKRAVGSVDPV
jgi:hypothetical protein